MLEIYIDYSIAWLQTILQLLQGSLANALADATKINTDICLHL